MRSPSISTNRPGGLLVCSSLSAFTALTVCRTALLLSRTAARVILVDDFRTLVSCADTRRGARRETRDLMGGNKAASPGFGSAAGIEHYGGSAPAELQRKAVGC